MLMGWIFIRGTFCLCLQLLRLASWRWTQNVAAKHL